MGKIGGRARIGLYRALMAGGVVLAGCGGGGEEEGQNEGVDAGSLSLPDGGSTTVSCSGIHESLPDGFEPAFVYRESLPPVGLSSHRNVGPSLVSDAKNDVELPAPPLGPPFERPIYVNGMLALYLGAEGDASLCLVPADGKRQVVEFEVTGEFDQDRFRIGHWHGFSPDGTHVLWSDDSGVHVGEVSSGTVTTLGPPGARAVHPVHTPWSPSGERVLFEGAEEGLFTVRRDGTELTRIGADVSRALWSPDGSQVAWVTPRAITEIHDLYVAEPDGENARMILEDRELSLLTLFWTEAGLWFDLGDWRDNTSGRWSGPFFRVEPSGSSEPVEVPLPEEAEINVNHAPLPLPSPDGTHVAYSCDVEIDFSQFTGVCVDSRVVSPTGIDTRVAAYQRTYAWAPDSSRLAFVAEDGVYSVQPDGSDLRKIEGGASLPSWAPDSSEFAFSSGDGIYVASPDAKEAQRVGLGAAWEIQWSADGEWLFFGGVSRASSSAPAETMTASERPAFDFEVIP